MPNHPSPSPLNLSQTLKRPKLHSPTLTLSEQISKRLARPRRWPPCPCCRARVCLCLWKVCCFSSTFFSSASHGSISVALSLFELSLSLSHCDVSLCSVVEYSPCRHLPFSLTAGNRCLNLTNPKLSHFCGQLLQSFILVPGGCMAL
ncbi:hypothetical protein S83_040187 [Arachis hypogaea]